MGDRKKRAGPEILSKSIFSAFLMLFSKKAQSPSSDFMENDLRLII